MSMPNLKNRALYLLSLLSALFLIGCRMCTGASGLMMISSNAVYLGGYAHEHIFGPWIVVDGYSITDEDSVERSFSFRNPDGYDVVLKGYRKTEDGLFEPDVEVFSENMSPTFRFLTQSHAILEISIWQAKTEICKETVCLDDMLLKRGGGDGPCFYNHYILAHIDGKLLDVWKDFSVHVKVVGKSRVPMPDNIKLQLVVTGRVIL